MCLLVLRPIYLLTESEREAEDVELGQDEDLAADVDDGDAESDPEALDSDDDAADIEIDEQSDSECPHRYHVFVADGSTRTCPSAVLASTERSATPCIQASARGSSTCDRFNKRC